jgi:DNA-binding NarL/FixJ family response regulator
MKQPRILIVDDHEIVRMGLVGLLAKTRPEWDICGEATDGDESIRFTRELNPDIVILDITMPRVSGLEACSRMRKVGITVPVLIFTTHDFERLSVEVREVGAQGYVLKSEAAHQLVQAIDTLLAGGTFFGAPPKSEPVRGDKPNPGLTFFQGIFQGFALAT